jgi:tRNA A-37 threonylcarbamoyl transferase component Bud32
MSNNYIDFDYLRNLIKFQSETFFSNYLNDIYDSLLKRIPTLEQCQSMKISVQPNGITSKIFNEYMGYQFYISKKLFNALCKNKNNILSKSEFRNGLFNLFLGDFNQTVDIIFDLYDFNKDGKIYKSDVKLILNYLPLKENINYETQKDAFEKIEIIVDKTFNKKNQLNKEDYINVVKENVPETFLNLLLYFYMNLPFDINGVNSYKYLIKKGIFHQRTNPTKLVLLNAKNNKRLNSKKLSTKNIFEENEKKNNNNNFILGSLSLRKKSSSTKNLFENTKIKNFEEYQNQHQKIIKTKDFINATPKPKNEKTSNLFHSSSSVKLNQTKENFLFSTTKKKFFNNNNINNKISNNTILKKNISGSTTNIMKGTNLFKKSILNSHSNLNLVNANVKYKLSPVIKYSKFSPNSDYIKKNIEKEKEVEEEIDDFILCEDENDDNNNNNEIKNFEILSSKELLRFSLPESSKKIKLMEKSNSNNVNNNNVNNSPSINNKNNEMFDNNLPKLSIQIEDYIYKYDKNEFDLKRFYCCIKGFDLLFFSSNLKNDFVNLFNFRNTFLTSSDKVNINKISYFPIKISFSNNNYLYLYFISDKIRNKWLNKMKEIIKNFDFEDYYELKENLGEGDFATVQKCIKKSNGKIFAVKKVLKKKIKYRDLIIMEGESSILKLIHHPNLVELIDYFESEDKIFMVMDYLEGGDLIKFICDQEPMTNVPEKTIAKIIYRIGKAIQYLHNYGMVHRDLKPENIVFGKNNDINSLKIIDFGLTVTLGYEETVNDLMGTVTYLAPEVYTNKPYDFKVDVWSIGVILYYLLSGILPFDDENLNDELIGKKIVFSHHEFAKEFFEGRSRMVINLIEKCLEKNPEKRIDINEFLNDDWFVKNQIKKTNKNIKKNL